MVVVPIKYQHILFYGGLLQISTNFSIASTKFTCSNRKSMLVKRIFGLIIVVDLVLGVSSQVLAGDFGKLKIRKIGSSYGFKSLSGDSIEIGEERHSAPQPYLKLNKWDGEVTLKVDIPYAKNGEKSLAQNRLRWVNHKYDVEFYPKEPEEIIEKIAGIKHSFTINDGGGVEFDVILKEKPDSNIFEFPIEAQGLKFYYQPPLHPAHPTWADTNGDGKVDTFRPENVVGSYAVYHESKQGDYTKLGGKNYKTGKVFHIYRPKVTDAEGKEIWGELNIDEKAGILTITISQNWLDNAVYPVTIDPNFGYETVGGSFGDLMNDVIKGSWFTCPEDGTAQSLSMYISNGWTDEQVKGAIYKKSDNFLVGSTEEKIILGTPSWSPAWYTFNFFGSPSLSAGEDYFLVGWANKNPSGSFKSIYYDDVTEEKAGYQDKTYGSWPDQWSPTLYKRRFSIYCTYTAAPTGITISGTIYTNEAKSADVGSGVTVGLSVNGAPKTTVDTTAGGVFSFSSITVAANDTITLFIDNHPSYEANLITQAVDSSTDITGLEMYTEKIVLRHETVGPMTNTLLATADDSGDDDIHYTISGANVDFDDGYEVWIDSGKTYTPGGTVEADDLEVSGTGTFNPEANAVTIHGSWKVSATGSFTSSGTVTFDAASGTETIITGGTDASHDFQNLTKLGGGILQLSTNPIDIEGILTISVSTTFDLNGQNLTVSGALANNGTLQLFGSESVSIGTMDTDSGTVTYVGDGDGTSDTFTIADFGTTDYYNLIINDTHATKDIFQTNADLTVAGALNVTSGTLDISTNTLTTTGILTVDGGTLIATGGNIDANGAVTITGGELIAPSGNFNVATDFSHTAGTFTHSSGTVVFDDSSQISTISGDTTFYNLTCTTSGKQINFTAGTTQTVSSTLTLTGASGNLITLRSTSSGSKWGITLSGAAQTVSYIDVKDADANTNTVTCYNSIDSGNNNANWVFNTVGISSPTDGRTVGSTPVVIGTAGSSDTVVIKDKDGRQVATTTADANGNFRIALSAALAIGENSLTPYVGTVSGPTINITVVAEPTPDQVPTITSPAEGQRIFGATPTITGEGLAGQSVSIKANDANGNLLLQEVGSGTVDISGNYSITLTTPLPKGKNYLTVTVDGVTSDIRTVTLADPFGVVFDSLTNNPIEGAVVTIFNSDGSQCTPGVEIDAGDTNPQTTGADGTYSFLCADGNYYITITASGYAYPSARTSFPAGRTIVTGSKGEVFTVAGAVIEMDHPMDANTLLLKIKKDANKKEVVIGDVVTYTVTIKNETASDVTNVYLEDRIPVGFKYISGKAILDNTPISDSTGNRPIVFDIGTLNAGTTKTLKYQLVVGSGVTLGNYENTAYAKYSDGTIISNKATKKVKVVSDPLFSLGTIIGKVFWDWDEDGVQKTEDRDQKSEVGIPKVQIVMEDGTVVTTDKDGKYHLPAVIPGRHLLRLDERTLPQGAHLTTDKVVIVDISPGILAKVNFGVTSHQSPVISNQRLPVKITQRREKPTPRLNVALRQSTVYSSQFIEKGKLSTMGYGLSTNYEFRIFTNYSLFIKKWKLEIFNKDTKRLIRKFEGTRLTIDEPIYWDGKDRKGKLINPERNFVYVLTVTGKDGSQDITKERELKVTSHQSQITSFREKEKSDKEEEADYKEWIQRESKVNNLEQQNIRIEGETVLVHSPQSIVRSIRIKKGDKIECEIPVVKKEGLTAKDLLESKSGKGTDEQSEVEIILPKGEYDIQVVPQGSQARIQKSEAASQITEEDRESLTSDIRPLISETYSQHIKVGEDYLFFVGMGDAKLGYTFNRGNIESVQQDDKFKKGFWSEGKLAYYLKGKIKGKYLITSSLDTERDKKELFRNLDPDKYYPVYGDASSIDYKATDTQGMLYLLIEWDKSSILWGNYETGFSDTEFTSFSRTLYGGKVHLESVSTTSFGEPHTKLIVFKARAQQKAGHNEFTGAGGSLFYLKHKDIIEGSEKVKIEVRDKITGLILATKELEEGVDYEIDHSNGRFTFWQPISSMVESDFIISSHLLDGNPVYVVVDYEYETKDKYDEGTYGLRAQQSLTDYLPSTFSKMLGLRIGSTYVQEEQLDKNYTLLGTDAVIHLGKDIKFTAEFAKSESEAVGSFISTDGGLSWAELPTGDLDKGKAYGLKSEAYLFDRLGLTSYYKRIEKGFSSTSTISQQGKELLGGGLNLDITPKTRLRVRHDIQKLIDDGNPQTQLQVGANKTETTSVQLQHEMITDKLNLTAEYRKQQVKEKKEQFESETNIEEDTVALRADYKLTEKIDVSLEQQATLKGAANHQIAIGVNAQVNEYLSLRAKETVGTEGTAVGIGATSKVKDKFEISGDYTKTNYRTGEVGDTVSFSGKAQIDDKTEVHTTLTVTDTFGGGQTQSIVFGSQRKINEQLTLTTDRTYAKSRDKLTQTNTFGLVREKDERRLEGTFTQQHSQSDTEASCTNIFGLSGDINDKWAAGVSFERGKVQNHDGTLSIRNAGSIGLGFVDRDKETGEVQFKASSKLELRLDDGEADKRQYLIYGAIEGKINLNTTLFAKADISQTKNTTTDSTEAQYKELTTGIAYRPVNFDRLNLLAKYTYLEDNSPSGQSNFSDIEKEKSHILAAEAVYDLTDKWQVVEKLAYKQGEEKVAGFEFTKTQTWLMVHRLNYKIDKDWQIGAEYRRLAQKQAEDVKQGVLVEVARKIGEFIQVGAGYNFTDFNDDLTHLDYTAQGPFIRLTGKFYDRTPEEIERARQRWLEERIEQWAWELVNEELAKPDSPIMQELYRLYYLAKEFENKGKLNLAKEYYQRCLQIGRVMYAEAEEYVRGRIELEKKLKRDNQLALEYYRQGRLLEARELWQRIKQEARPELISMEVEKWAIR